MQPGHPYIGAPYAGPRATYVVLSCILTLVLTMLISIWHGSASPVAIVGLFAIYIGSAVGEDETIQFYRKFGFEVRETVPDYYKRLDPPDAIILAKALQG